MNNQAPTPEQAFNIITQACHEFVGKRRDHEVLEQALQVIRGILPKAE
jgi:hypothetical protein